jgi:hypothetical protein
MATDQAAIVGELVRRRDTLEPDKQAIVSELAKRFDVQDPRSSVNVSFGGEAPPQEQPETLGIGRQFLQASADTGIGIAKGIGNTAYGIGMMARKYIPGLAWAGNKISDWTQGGHMTDEEMETWRKEKLSPTNLSRKVGFGAEQIAEFFVPGTAINKSLKLAEAGARFAEAVPKLAKIAPAIEYGARGALEAIPAVAIAKAQGQEGTSGVAAMAMVGPTFGKLLNMTGASRVGTATAKGIVGKVSKELAEKIPEVTQSPRQMMWRALKPYVRNRDFDKAMNEAMPEIYAQAKMAGKKIENVSDFITIAKATQKRIWAPYEKFLGESKATIEGSAIADAIKGSIAPRQLEKYTKTNKRGIQYVTGPVKELYDWAEKFRFKKIPIQQAEDYLQNVNAETQEFYGMYPAMRHAAKEANVKLAGAMAEADAWREAINKIIEQSHPKVKAVYGGISNLLQEAYRRVNVAKRLAPESLVEQMANVHAAGEFAEGLIMGHPLTATAKLFKGKAYQMAAKTIKERNTSDYLIKQAFNDFGEYIERQSALRRIPTAIMGTAKKAPEESK